MRLSRHPTFAVLASLALFVAGAGTVLFGFMTLGYHVALSATVISVTIGTVLIAGAVTLAVVTERQLRRDEEEQKALAPPEPAPRAKKEPRRDPAALTQPDRLLAEWTLEPFEWLAFSEARADVRKRAAAYNAVLGAVLGAMMLGVFAERWRYSVIGMLVGAAVAFIGTHVSARRLRTRMPEAGAGVVIRRNTVEIDGQSEVLRDGTWWLSAAKLREDLALPVLELSVKKTTHERGGRRRMMERVVRVPIPRGREAQAAKVAEQLRRGIPDEDDDD
ncbi:MAG TPA: hypothetical protein VFS20_01725 [Longimicrobium sp.]|nr:hypothetical protein [Longimicrobium sp.]